MKVLVLAVFSVIAISLSDAHYRKKPNIEVFEIKENQLTNKIQVQPVKLRYDLESDEKDAQTSLLSKILLSQKKKKNAASKNIVKKINALEGVQAAMKKKQPIVMFVSPEYLDVLDSRYSDSADSLMSSFLDETRTQGLLKPGAEVVFNIVPPRRPRVSLKQLRLPAVLRGGYLAHGRTSRPPSRDEERPYDNEFDWKK